MKAVSKSLEDTQKIAGEIRARLLPRPDTATLLALSGDLGAGKTALVQALARAYGVAENITSPTFVIEKIYKLDGQLFEHLIHIDAYRVAHGSELVTLGWHDIIANPKNLICIEWPENVRDLVPPYVISIECEFIDETSHTYTYEIGA
jgi:tRNA threonylcarbamoyladenosine biosynthesis protein TsaE